MVKPVYMRTHVRARAILDGLHHDGIVVDMSAGCGARGMVYSVVSVIGLSARRRIVLGNQDRSFEIANQNSVLIEAARLDGDDAGVRPRLLSRLPSTSDSRSACRGKQRMSQTNFAPAELAIAFWLTSVTLIPTRSATVKGEQMMQRPNSLCLAYSASKCIGCVFIVRSVNRCFRFSVIVGGRCHRCRQHEISK